MDVPSDIINTTYLLMKISPIIFFSSKNIDAKLLYLHPKSKDIMVLALCDEPVWASFLGFLFFPDNLGSVFLRGGIKLTNSLIFLCFSQI